MITITPAGLSSSTGVADQLSIGLTITEKVGKSFCVNSTLQPQVDIVYTKGTPVLNGSTVFVPISAIITLVIPASSSCCGCNTVTKLYTENFILPFQGQTAVPTSVTITSLGRISGGSNITCCKANSYTIQDSLTVLIA